MELKSSISPLNWSNLKRNEGQVQLPKFSTNGLLPKTEMEPSSTNDLYSALLLQTHLYSCPQFYYLYSPVRQVQGTVGPEA